MNFYPYSMLLVILFLDIFIRVNTFYLDTLRPKPRQRKCRGGRRKQRNIPMRTTHRLPYSRKENISTCERNINVSNLIYVNTIAIDHTKSNNVYFIQPVSSRRPYPLCPLRGSDTFNLIPCGVQSFTHRPLPPPLPRLRPINLDKQNLIHIDCENTSIEKSNRLKFLYFNARSCVNKALELNDFIIQTNSDLIFISETWLKHDDDHIINELVPKGFDILSVPRPTRAGGGVAIVFKNSLTVNPVRHVSFSSFEVCALTVEFSHVKFYCACIYCPPHSRKNNISTSHFLSELNDFFDSLNTVEHIYILGDLNFHFEKKDDPDVKKLSTLFEEHSTHQLVTGPTHHCGHTLDLLITRDPQSVHDLLIIDKCLSDHFVISYELSMAKPKFRKTLINSRNLKNVDMLSFKAKLYENLSACNHVTLPEFLSCIKAVLDQCAPQKDRFVSCRPFAPWVNAEVKAQKQIKHKAERLWRKTNLTVHREIFIDEKKNTNKLIRREKKKFINNKITKCKSSKELYSITNDLLGKSKKTNFPKFSSSLEQANVFNKFFIEKVDTIRNNLDISCSTRPSFVSHEGPCLENFTPISSEQVINIIKDSKKTTCQLDPLPTDLFFQCIDIFCPYITKIFNDSLSSGILPPEFKDSIITPLLKKSNLDPNLLKNFRPVSNLTFLSKVLERIAYNQILDHLTSNDLIQSLQSAYKSKHSTETALLKVTNDILTACDEGNISFLTLLDLSAAFDTIDHNILIDRLCISFGIKGTVLSWLKSYLSDRRQMVKVLNSLSTPLPIKFGVPQGSVLGPLLFSLYIQPLSEVISMHNLSFHLYADDSQIYKSFPSLAFKFTIKELTDCISNVNQWMKANKLKMNNEKTEFILFGSKSKLNSIQATSIKIDDVDIPIATKVRDLGPILDSNLTMNQTISHVRTSCYLELRKISHIRNLISEQAAKQLALSFVISKLDYCNSLLFGITKENINKLQLIQNHAARVVKRVSKSHSSTELLKELHWLPIKARIQYKIAVIVYQCLNDPNFPSYLKSSITPYVPSRSLRSSHHNLLVKHSSKLKSLGERSFSFAAPDVWNGLPNSLRLCDNFDTFKRDLKTYLFSTHFDQI